MKFIRKSDRTIHALALNKCSNEEKYRHKMERISTRLITEKMQLLWFLKVKPVKPSALIASRKLNSLSNHKIRDTESAYMRQKSISDQ